MSRREVNRVCAWGFLLACFGNLGCLLPKEGRGGSGGDAGAAHDAVLDASTDAGADAAVDVDAALDEAAADAALDADADAALDLAPDLLSDAPVDADATVDTGVDRGPDRPGLCTADEIPIGSVQRGCPTNDCSYVSCDKDTSGGLVMKYAIDCRSGDHIWALCNFAPEQSFVDFDLAYDAEGIMEVVFCVDVAPIEGEINLWYGRHPIRKILRLVRAGEVLGPGCYVRYFAPSQARFPGWDEIPKDCREKCGDVPRSCLAEFRATVDEYAHMDGGASYDFRATGMQLAAENCDGEASGTIRLTGIKHLSGGCGCSGSGPCAGADRPQCRLTEPGECAWPGDLPPGVCGPRSIGCTGPPGTGVPCTVTVGERTCESLTECVDGQYVCPASGCAR